MTLPTWAVEKAEEVAPTDATEFARLILINGGFSETGIDAKAARSDQGWHNALKDAQAVLDALRPAIAQALAEERERAGELRAILQAAEAQIVGTYRGISPKANYGVAENRFADTDRVVQRIRAVLAPTSDKQER